MARLGLTIWAFVLAGQLGLPLAAHSQLFNPVATRPTELGFGGSPLNFFSQIPAVNYDAGGNNIGYNVPSPNCQGNACVSGAATYRPDAVNFKSSVFNASFPYQLGFVTSPNSYNYTINISSPGPYSLTLWTGSPSSGGSWAVFIDNLQVATVTTPNTGNYSTLQSAVSSQFSVTTGTHIMRLAWASGDALRQAGDLVAWQGNIANVVATKTITTFTMVNDTSGTLQAGTPVSFGQAFAYGDVLPGTYPLIRDAQTHQPLAGQQWDEISRWIENGGNKSWRHAVWAAWLPTSVPAGGTYQVEFVVQNGTYSQSSHQALSVLCSGNAAHDFKIHLTDVRNTNNTPRDSGDATFRVCNNIANVGRDAPRHFRAGNVYDEYQVSGLFVYTSGNKDPQLYAQCDIDIFTKSSDGTSPGDVSWVCNVHNSFENVASGSAGNAGAPGPVGLSGDPQTIAYVAEIDDGAVNVLDWRGLNATIVSANNPVGSASTLGCGSSGGLYCMIVPSSTGKNAWYFGQAVRATCVGGCIGGVTNDKAYFVWPSSSAAQAGADTTKVALCVEPTCNGDGPNGGSGALALDGTQGAGNTTFTTLIMHYHWTTWQTLDTTGQKNWSPAGTTNRQTRKIYPAFTNAEKRYWESSGIITPINLSQPVQAIGYDWSQGESVNYNPNGRLNVVGGSGTGGRPDLGNPGEWAAEAWLSGGQSDWDAARLFTLGTPWHGFTTVINEATGRMPALNNGPPTGPGGNGSGTLYAGLGALQPGTNWAPNTLGGLTAFNTSGPYPGDGLFTFGTSLDHMPGFDGFAYAVFGDRSFLDLMQWQANRDYLQRSVGPGLLLGQGGYRDNNATFTDGNTYHYYGLLTACCQERGSSWLIRDVTNAAAFGQDQTAAYPDGTFNSERAVFDDMVTETSNYWPMLLKFHDGPGNSNFSTSIWPPFNAADMATTAFFMQGYAASVAYMAETMLHTPSAVTWNGEFQRFIEGTVGGQLPGMAASTSGGVPSYYAITYQLLPAIHDGSGTWGQFGENIGPCINGTDATDFGWWTVESNLLTGGHWSASVPHLANGDTVKGVDPWDVTIGHANLDQLSGTIWYPVMNVNQGVNPTQFDIQCPVGHAVDATCPTPGQPFTGFTLSGAAAASQTESLIYRFKTDPGPGQGYDSGVYAQYGGSIMNGLAIAGFSVPNAQADFASRCGSPGGCYNPANPSNWYDTSIVVPGLPAAVNGLPPSASGTATISSIAVAPASFTAQAGNAGSLVGSLSASVSSGSFAGTFAIDSSSACSGPANASFAISGSNLDVGASDLATPGSYTLCVRATDAHYSNSPLVQAITVTGVSSTCSTPQVVTDKSTYAAGDTITVTTSCGTGNPKDWVTVYTAGSEIGPNVAPYFAYLGVTTPGATATLQAPKVITDRDLPYEIVWYANDTFVRVQTSASFTVTKSITPAAPVASLPAGLAADPFVPAHVITVCSSGCDQTSIGNATDQAFNAGWDNVQIKVTCGDYNYPPLVVKTQYSPHVWIKGICPDGVSRPHLFGKTSASGQIIRNSVFYGTGAASLILDNLELGPWNDWISSPIDGATWTLRNDYIRDAPQGLISGNSTDMTLNIYNSVFSRNGYSTGPEHNVYVGEGNLGSTVNVVNSVFDQPQYGHAMKERAKNYNASCSLFAVNEDDFYVGSEATDIDSGQPNITNSVFISGGGAPRSWTDNNTWDSIRYGADTETGSNPPILGILPAAPAINSNLFVDDVPAAGHWFVTLGLRLLNPDGSPHPVTWSNNRFVWPDAGAKQPDVGGVGVADATGAIDSLGPPHTGTTNDVTLDGTNQYFTGGRPSAGLTPVGTYPKGWRDYLSLMPSACTDPVGLVKVPTN